jgi:Inner membrane protein YgaP-like, transmembrane domain
MTCNIGKYERIIRGVVGVAVIVWGVMEQNWLGAIGLVPLGTALIGWCPPYALLGINTGCKTKND